MCIFCCDILCWFSFITCCGCRDIVTRRLVFFPPSAYYDNIEPNEKFRDFYRRLASKPDNNESDDMKHDHNQQRSNDIVLQVGHDTNVSTKHKKHEIHTSTHTSTNPHEMERLNSTDDTIISYDTHTIKASHATKAPTKRTQNGSITTTHNRNAHIDRDTFGTFRIKDDDTNLAKFYWHNYQLKMSNFSSQYLLTKRGTTIASYHIKHPSSTYTILFSHGNAADIGLMRNHLCRMYQKCGVSIFAYEYSGYGKSSGKASEKNTYADIERAYKYMTNTLGIKPAHIILYGQSLGTCVSIYLATQYPVGGVILHSPLMSGLRVMQHFDKTYWFDIYPVVEQIQQVFAPIFVTIATLSPTLSNEYDEASALTALYYSFGSYCNANVLQTWNCVPWCQSLPDFSVHTVVVDTAHKLQAFTGYDAKTKQVIISFRGTNNNHNKLLDTNWAQIYLNQNDRGMEHNVGEGDWAIHLGFYRGLLSLLHGGLLDSLWQIFDEHNEANVLLTGHSLGGALAQILALMFVVSPLVNDVPIGHVDIITFGSPRWGSKDIVTYFNTLAHNNWRVVNKYDMVPTLPWITEGDYGYYQPETEVLYTEFGTLEYRMCGSGEKGDDCVFNAAWDLKYHLTYLNVPNNDASCL